MRTAFLAPANHISAPAQLITAPAQPPATGAVVYMALFFCLFLMSALLLCTEAFLDRQTDRQKSRQTDRGTKRIRGQSHRRTNGLKDKVCLKTIISLLRLAYRPLLLYSFLTKTGRNLPISPSFRIFRCDYASL